MTDLSSKDHNITNFPFAVLSPELGTRSETFIHRHMAELLPGQTAVVVRRKKDYLGDMDIRFPYLVLEPPKRDIQWFVRGCLYLFRLNKLSPIQVTVAEYLHRYRVKIILSQYLDHSLKWLDVAQQLGIRFYAHAHGYDISKVLRNPIMCRRYLRLENADGIITMSEHTRQRLIKLGLSGANIQVIPYGINVPDTPVDRQNNGIIRCLAVGRMVGKKAPTKALEAFQRALKSDPRLRFDYVGDGDQFDDAQDFVSKHGLSGKVTLHGSQPNSVVQQLMGQADIFLQHSRTDPATGDEEGLPVAILEAMANSLPVVATRHAGIPEAVIENDTGYLVDEGDVKGMAVNILRLANDSEMRTEMGRKGWQRAKRHFTWEKEKASLLNLLGLETDEQHLEAICKQKV